jgi:hypothetical protein
MDAKLNGFIGDCRMRYKAIYNTHPTVNAIYDEVDAYDKDGNKIELDETLIEAEIARLQAEYEAKQYQRDRATEYPSIADQLDTLYHGGYDAWKAQVKAVKDKYPKG